MQSGRDFDAAPTRNLECLVGTCQMLRLCGLTRIGIFFAELYWRNMSRGPLIGRRWSESLMPEEEGTMASPQPIREIAPPAWPLPLIASQPRGPR
jgi:hypothetical protein